MILQDLLSLPIAGKNCLILGCPAAGKTFLSQQLDNASHEIIHTDDLLGYTIPQAIWSVFEDINHFYKKGISTITEGVLGYSLLLEGFKHKAYFPDIVIEIKISRAKQRQIYLRERDPAKIKHLKKFDDTHKAMMNEYYRLCPKESLPTIIEFQNTFDVTKETNKLSTD